ncbi:CASP-like protein UU3 [Physcomitrium patens]|uniref:CASP-like protein UU3 n=2 Tax=Physcomitrium patens TaxID=3218 RepID=CSPLE_PHYPA|nr:CASP-like protein UU3 [Physcomitrium patens]A9SG36.2 RecName: Full=CASP-like protein UU3; Short=PpCASPLUU3 [Physcomitrium patens]PNR51177.1 hypothetical protein PHYPA_010363 [Physcomitrium patens]|eukprot:XP_024380520.1 CASP-like protein UU3 [Physcomitrella patens]
MATAWESEYFDKVTPGERERAVPPMVPQQTPPPVYIQPQVSRNGIVASIVLRLLTLIFAVVALAVLASNTGSFQVSTGSATSVKTIKFTILSAFTYLFAVCGVVAVYSLLLIIVEMIDLAVRGFTTHTLVAIFVFVLDQTMAYVLISAASASANGVKVSRDESNITGYKFDISCSNLGIDDYCTKASASVAIAFIAFLFMAITAGVSARRLFKLP